MGSHASRPPSRASSDPIELKATLDGLRHIVRALRLSTVHAERAHGISGAQLFVLQNLVEGAAPSIAELAGRTATDASSVSVVVAKLVDQGLVARRPSKEDARRAEIALTKKGESIARSGPAVPQAQIARAFERLAPTTRKALARGLTELVKEMGAVGKPSLFFEDEPAAQRSTSSSRRRRATS